ncbi:MAG: carbohydrate ABC transporter permease [Eubacteriales bacterium]|nr:carbohydrate ABC transporter permease [Eubacteriales bacterium]
MHYIRSKKDLFFDIFVYFLLCIAMLIILYPLYFVIIASFSDPLEVLAGRVTWRPVGFSTEAYKMVFKDSQVMSGYKNTILYTLAGTSLNMVLTVAAAYPLSRRSLFGKNVILKFMVFTMFFSGGLIPTYLHISDMGLLNTFAVMILPTAISTYNVMIMRTFFVNSIPYELEEAAYVDGANHLRSLASIVIPLSKPILAVMVLFYAVTHWNAYFSALIYLSDEKRYPLQLVLRSILIQNQASEESLLNVESTFNRMLRGETIKYALIIVASVPVLCLYPFLQKYFVKGIMVGSIKG